MHHVVFLDRDSLPAPVRRPQVAQSYIEYAHTRPAEVVERLRGATIAITNKVPISAEAIEALPTLRLIAVAATGYDCVAIGACRARGIAVTNVRDYAVHTVSEHVFALVLALRRNLFAYRANVAAAEWQRSTQFCLRSHPIGDLHGASLGIVGAGAIGQATASLGRAFGMQVSFAAHPTLSPQTAPRLPLHELLGACDVVSIHCPLTEATRGLIGRDELRRMRPNSILINTARGGIVDESALLEALQSGRIAGAGIDVLATEPPVDARGLAGYAGQNLILTPHVAWSSDQALEALAAQLSDNIDAWAAGEARCRIV